MTRLLHGAIAAALVLGDTSAHAQGRSTSRQKPIEPQACRFIAPARMPAGSMTWLGACKGGLAQGPGVLRSRRSDEPPVLYFGSMICGRPGAGVVERGGDFYPLAGGDREDNVRAFRSAAEGARAVASRFAAQGNTASAKFYQVEVQRLERTLD